jgi:26S proteasome regulatory subunit T2
MSGYVWVQGPDASHKLPGVTPHTKCRLRLLKQERIKDYLLMEEEFIRNQERLKPQEEKNEEERTKVSTFLKDLKKFWKKSSIF